MFRRTSPLGFPLLVGPLPAAMRIHDLGDLVEVIDVECRVDALVGVDFPDIEGLAHEVVRPRGTRPHPPL